MYRWLIFIFFALACPAFGQAVQKDLTAADYHLWSRLSAGGLSADGKWASYHLSYQEGSDTLFVRQTTGKKFYHFPKCSAGTFFGKDTFVCMESGEGLRIIDLRSGKIQLLEKVQRYELTQLNYIVAEKEGLSRQRQLTIYNEKGKVLTQIEAVRSWSYNRESDQLIYQSEQEGREALYLFPVSKPFEVVKIMETGNAIARAYTWQLNSDSVAFLICDSEVCNIGLYRIRLPQYQELSPDRFFTSVSDKIFVSTSLTPLQISPDGNKVFFGIGNKAEVKTGTGVEVWNTADKLPYPAKVLLTGFESLNKTGCWEPDADRCFQITANELPKSVISGDGKNALLWNPTAYQPQEKQVGDVDYYLLDLETGDKKLLLKKQSSVEKQVFFSPAGKYVTYFRDNSWWVYDIQSGKSTNFTGGLPTSFTNEDYDWSGDVPPYGFAGWIINDQSFLVYDQFDVWNVFPDGRKSVRLTNGRETKTKFRILPQSTMLHSSDLSGKKSGSHDLNLPLILSGNQEDRRGYYMWTSKKACTPIAVSDTTSLSSVEFSAAGRQQIFVEQRFDLPPRLLYRRGNSAPKVLYQSNSHHNKYKWGPAEVVTYQNRMGDSLRGVLYYPAGYDPGKKYPVVVQVYESLSQRLYEYVNPRLYNHDGYNRSNLISQGYFVFEPDIKYELGNPGLSAVDCVTAGVKQILKIPGVNKVKIGLMGHSFGGYETNLILGKSDLFAAAVSGAGISDFTSHYLYMNTNRSRPNNFFFESGQFRMKYSLFEDAQGYAANSPLNFVHNISTPLLSWTGKNDRQVSPAQSMEFHLALQRLGKTNIMLVYPDEGHALMNKANQKDLTIRLEEWFAHYLKGALAPDWLRPDMF